MAISETRVHMAIGEEEAPTVLVTGDVQLREITMLIRSNRGHAAGEGAQ